jgi:cell division protein FtsW (lipid II flippase)
MALRVLFIVEALFSLVTGIGLVFLPETTLDVYGLETEGVGTFMTQNYGALYIGFGVLAWLVRNVTQREFVNALTTVFALWHLVLLGVALRAWLGDDFEYDLGWSSVLVESAFALAFAYFRIRPPQPSGASTPRR